MLPGLAFDGIDCGLDRKRKPCCVRLKCSEDIPQLNRFKAPKDRLQVIKENKNLVRHQSFGCLISEGEVLAFGTVDRDETLLASLPPVIVLRIADHAALHKVLVRSKSSRDLQFVQVDTAVFAYEPILKGLQRMREIPLKEQLIDLSVERTSSDADVLNAHQIDRIRTGCKDHLQQVLDTPKTIQLDHAQAESFMNGLTKRVSIIQGPPGN